MKYLTKISTLSLIIAFSANISLNAQQDSSLEPLEESIEKVTRMNHPPMGAPKVQVVRVHKEENIAAKKEFKREKKVKKSKINRRNKVEKRKLRREAKMQREQFKKQALLK
jgi:hypothetical protein